MMKTTIFVCCVSVTVVFTSSESVDPTLVAQCKELESRNSFAAKWERLTQFVKGAGDMWKAYR